MYIYELERIGAKFIPMPENGFEPTNKGFYIRGIVRIANDRYDVKVLSRTSIDSRVVWAEKIAGKCESGLSLKAHLRKAVLNNMNGISSYVLNRIGCQVLYYLLLAGFALALFSFAVMTVLQFSTLRFFIVCLFAVVLGFWRYMRHRIIFGGVTEVDELDYEEECFF